MRGLRVAVACTVGLIPVSAVGFVAVTNGNYFLTFTDIELSDAAGNTTMGVTRTYNSRTQFRGMLGYGWGNDFDTYLIPSEDGSIVIQEIGAGDKTRFQRPSFNAMELELLIGRIVDAKAAASASQNQRFDETAYRAHLMENADFRDEEARGFGLMRELPVGTVLYSAMRGEQERVVRTKNGYVRLKGDDTSEFFEFKGVAFDQGVDSAGMRRLSVYKLTRTENEVAKSYINLSYDALSGNLLQAATSNGEMLRFETDKEGRVIKIASSRDETATYEYCGSVGYNIEQRCQKADLVSVRETSGAVYKYAYDNLHNLIELTYPDKTKESISYYSVAFPGTGGVKKVILQNGVTIDYDYWADPAAPDLHYRTNVLTTYTGGTVTRTSYEYLDKRRDDGSTHRSRMISRTGGEESETIYDECCNQPRSVTASGRVTEFEYDDDTHSLKEKRTPDEISRWTYSPVFRDKITKFLRIVRSSGNIIAEYDYDYDGQRRLIRASSSEGHRVAITYDPAGRIGLVEDESGTKLTFEYGTGSKPTRLAIGGVSAVTITYDATGNIQDVKSDEGSSVAVVSVFNTLLELVKSAGINPP